MALALVALAPFFAPSAHASSCTNGVETITVATWSNNLYDVPIHYASREGLDARECVKIEFRSFRQLGNFALALVNGEVDLVADISAVSAIHRRAGDLASVGTDVSASVVFTHANRSLYALVGPKTDSPQLSALMGQKVASGTCGWDGDVTVARTDPQARNASSMTEGFILFLRTNLPQARLWCGEQTDDPEFATEGARTVYLQPRGYSSKRVAAFKSGDSSFVLVTTPQQYGLADEQDVTVYVTPQQIPEFQEDAIVALASRLSDAAFVARMERFFNAVNAARAALAADREAAARWVLAFAQGSERGSIKGISTLTHAQAATNLALDHIWSETGCIVRSSIERYTVFMGHPDGTILYDPNRLCS